MEPPSRRPVLTFSLTAAGWYLGLSIHFYSILQLWSGIVKNLSSGQVVSKGWAKLFKHWCLKIVLCCVWIYVCPIFCCFLMFLKIFRKKTLVRYLNSEHNFRSFQNLFWSFLSSQAGPYYLLDAKPYKTNWLIFLAVYQTFIIRERIDKWRKKFSRSTRSTAKKQQHEGRDFKKPNLHYTHRLRPKLVTSFRGPSPRHYAWAYTAP